MTHHWDEFSKSLVEETVPRRESLRRLGIALAGAVLSPLGLGTALARGSDPCKSFCNQCPKSQRSRCLAACNACNKDPSRLCGTCGSYVCCGSGRTCCSGYCTDLADDVLNCGGCGFVCEPPGPYEFGACIDGRCEYVCGEGAIYCNGVCTFLGVDPFNCGGCGNVCGGSTPYCTDGVCTDGVDCASWETRCGSVCVNTYSDENNCGGCGIVCPSDNVCLSGLCVNPDQPPPTGY
jgi:hypothetical protein